MALVRLYIDTSVWNGAFDDHAVLLRDQTQRFFELARTRRGVRLYLSDIVLQELGNAPVSRRSPLAQLIHGAEAHRLDLDEETAVLAAAYVEYGVLTPGHLADAQHVAIATVAEVDVLVSWNYRHLVNRRRREAFNGLMRFAATIRLKSLAPRRCSMNEAIPPSLQEVWDWKRATEQATAGMSRAELIEFYRRQADEVQRMLGIELPRHPASAERHAAEPWNRHR